MNSHTGAAAVASLLIILSIGAASGIGAAHPVNSTGTLDDHMGPGYHHGPVNSTFGGHMGPGYQRGPVDGMWNGHMWGPGFGGWFFLWLLVFIALIVGFVYWLTRRRTEEEDRAMRILREQYAKGEVEDEEFEERRSKLRTE